MRLEVFDYIDIWNNRERRHSVLNSITVEEFNNQITCEDIVEPLDNDDNDVLFLKYYNFQKQ